MNNVVRKLPNGEVELKKYNMNLTQAKWRAHKDVIIAFLFEGKDVECLFGKDKWAPVGFPEFLLNAKYRISPKVLFTNSIGEKFTEETELVYVFDISEDLLYTISFEELEKEDCGDQIVQKEIWRTEIFKTPQGALKAAIKYYDKL